MRKFSSKLVKRLYRALTKGHQKRPFVKKELEENATQGSGTPEEPESAAASFPATNTYSAAPRSFSAFQQLPYELREQIRFYATPPRTIHIHITNAVTHLVDMDRLSNFFMMVRIEDSVSGEAIPPSEFCAVPSLDIRSTKLRKPRRASHLSSGPAHTPHPWRMPAMLAVCRDSRSIAMRRYELGMGSLVTGSRPTIPVPNKGIWIDYKQDLLYVTMDNIRGEGYSAQQILLLLSRTSRETVRKVQNLAVNGTWEPVVWNYTRYRRTLRHSLKHYKMLRNLTLLFDTFWNAPRLNCWDTSQRTLKSREEEAKDWIVRRFIEAGAQQTSKTHQSPGRERRIWRVPAVEVIT